MDVTVTDVPAESRFEGRLADGALVGLVEYHLEDGVIAFTHTEVPVEHEGEGIAGQVVAHALDAARERGLRVVALCPYVRAYLRRHPQYQDLVGQLPAGPREG